MGYNYQEADINIRKTSNFQTKKYQIRISQAMTKDELKNMLWYLHNTTFRNEKQIQNSKQCGCFHCGRIFPAETVTEWCDESENEDKTALCPFCMIDSVLGDASGVNITDQLMTLMNIEFFGEGIDSMDIKFN